MFNYHRPEAWHRSRLISVAVIVFGLMAVPIGLANPHGNEHRASAEHTALQRQRDRADSIAGFPIAPHPDAPPRGPGA
jgi:hypothetical protein